jgi:hypothetical protein
MTELTEQELVERLRQLKADWPVGTAYTYTDDAGRGVSGEVVQTYLGMVTHNPYIIGSEGTGLYGPIFHVYEPEKLART